MFAPNAAAAGRNTEATTRYANICSMTAQGSALTRMRRAVRGQSVEVALSAAAELDHVGLDDALDLCLMLRGDRRYEPAALRWLTRLIAERRAMTIVELTVAVDALVVLGNPQAPAETAEGKLRALLRKSW
jgi:hypothetical protein